MQSVLVLSPIVPPAAEAAVENLSGLDTGFLEVFAEASDPAVEPRREVADAGPAPMAAMFPWPVRVPLPEAEGPKREAETTALETSPPQGAMSPGLIFSARLADAGDTVPPAENLLVPGDPVGSDGDSGAVFGVDATLGGAEEIADAPMMAGAAVTPDAAGAARSLLRYRGPEQPEAQMPVSGTTVHSSGPGRGIEAGAVFDARLKPRSGPTLSLAGAGPVTFRESVTAEDSDTSADPKTEQPRMTTVDDAGDIPSVSGPIRPVLLASADDAPGVSSGNDSLPSPLKAAAGAGFHMSAPTDQETQVSWITHTAPSPASGTPDFLVSEGRPSDPATAIAADPASEKLTDQPLKGRPAETDPAVGGDQPDMNLKPEMATDLRGRGPAGFWERLFTTLSADPALLPVDENGPEPVTFSRETSPVPQNTPLLPSSVTVPSQGSKPLAERPDTAADPDPAAEDEVSRSHLVVLQGLVAATGLVSATHAAPSQNLHVPQVAEQITAALSHSTDGATELALSPDELGRVQLRLERDAKHPDRMVVMITFERPETLDLFRRHAGELAEALRSAGYAGADIGFGQQGSGSRTPDRNPGMHGQGPDYGAGLSNLPDAPDAATTTPRLMAGASLDLRL